MKPIVVQKYGGSSVASPEKIRAVAQRVARTKEGGKRVVVVVSAMGDTTDELLRLARRMTETPPRRELDMLLTAGERISMALLSMALQELGVEAISFTGSQSGIITNDAHAGARIIEVRPYRLQDELERDKVVIVAGYQGVSYKKEVTTLGRGGSDTTAIALCAALGAQHCEICSDVDGVYTADPAVVDDARRLAEISYEEMQVLAESGAKVLHATAVEYARHQGIAIWVRATASDPVAAESGTWVRVGGPGDGTPLAGVAARGVVLLQVPADSAQRVQGLGSACAAMDAPVLWLSWSGAGAPATAIVPTDDLHDEGFAAEIERHLGTTVSIRRDVSAVSAVGAGLDRSPDVVRRVLEVCEESGAQVHHLERTSLRVTVVVDASAAQAVTRGLHAALVGP